MSDYLKRVRQAVPAELKREPIWLLHNSKKVPYYCDGKPRSGALDSTEDRARLVTFDAAAEAFSNWGRFAGLGIALGEIPGGIHVSGIDLDHIAQDDSRTLGILAAADSYAETSPSGDGLHILGTGNIGVTKLNGGAEGLEIYDRRRYFTVTGNRLNQAGLNDLTDAARVARELFSTEGDKRPGASSQDDSTVAELKRQGLYLSDQGDGKHFVRCPWSSRHTSDDTQRDAAYFDDTWQRDGKRGPGFKCQHSHCEDRRLRHLREYLGLDDEHHAPDVELIAFELDKLLAPPAPPRYLIPGLIPTEAYSVAAGALSAGKTTMVLSLMIWRATGVDILDLDTEGRRQPEVGPCVFITYEDPDSVIQWRILTLVQAAHQRIVDAHGPRAGRDFLSLFAKHFQRITLTGKTGAMLVSRGPTGLIGPNVAQIDRLTNRIRAFADRELLLAVDPLRLAFHGSQNNDDDADIIVHTLNNLAQSFTDSGLIVASHTTKANAVEGQAGRMAAAYATSGSALYSQHARSNFHIGRLSANKARELAPGFLTDEEIAKERITVLTHARLSYGTEADAAHYVMRGGTLVPLPIVEPENPVQRLVRVLPDFAAALDRMIVSGGNPSRTAMESDVTLCKKMTRKEIRDTSRDLIGQGWLQIVGKGPMAKLTVTDAGKARIPPTDMAG